MTDDAASARDADQSRGAASSTDSLPPPFPPPTPPPYEPPPDDRPAGDGPTFDRAKLIRPLRPRYVAGVCGALGRATNTDPVLWRVLLTVLAIFGGAGVLIYLVGWLAIPAENDTASPVESLLGRGRSSMKPLSIVLLGAAAVLTFAFVVNDGFRAALLAIAVLVGAAVLIRRGGPSRTPFTSPFTPPAAAPPASAPPPFTPPAPAGPAAPGEEPTAQFPAAGAAQPAAAPEAPAASEPPTEPLIPPAPEAPRPPQFGPPASGYRPPFAPHGPYASPAQQATAPPPPAPPRQPKAPKEKSKLGSMTFFALVLVMGLLTMLSLSGVHVTVSAFFAAALATIALGLIVGAWIGRARGLIALALIATLGLGVSSGLERFGGQIGSNVYRPAALSAVADRYDFTVGNAVLDLRRIDFAGAEQTTTIEMKVGQIQVLLPPNVDVTADVGMNEGRVVVFGTEYDAQQAGAQPFTDQGKDGPGGGSLKLNILMTTGNVEVTR
ncbi:PspC domain-containing protein [Actinoplanes sp. NPDC049265]|uniref:PspC domain-containing protein n=1 Tax=Actinoplanes sp. NPDC049265 TaxID=3363902 RepID=UPI0037220C77